MNIEKSMVISAYEVGKLVHFGVLTRNQGKEKIYQETGMNVGSANDYITVLLDMIEGKEYHRTINNFATKYYLDNIKKDFGMGIFSKALEAGDRHAKYYSKLGRGHLRAIEQIIDEYKEGL